MSEEYLFVVPTASIGGAERVMFNLVTYLLDKNKHVTLVTMSKGKQTNGWSELEHHSNFKWIPGFYKSEKSSLIPITSKLIDLDNRHKFDYIFSSHLHVNSYLSSLKRVGFFKKSYLISRESFTVFEKYSNYKKHLFKRIYCHLYGSQDLLICQTESMKSSLIINLGFRPVNKIEVIPNPVNLEYINSHIQNAIKEKIVIACGRLTDIKQFDLLINAFHLFSKTHPEYKLVILGDGVLREKLQAQINTLGISKKVILVGKTANPFLWFAKSEIGIISSKREGFPNVLLEMMASGTSKIVATPCTGGLSDISGLIITNDTSMESILEGLNKAAILSDDLSPIYQKYISRNHSVDSFWNSVLQIVHD